MTFRAEFPDDFRPDQREPSEDYRAADRAEAPDAFSRAVLGGPVAEVLRLSRNGPWASAEMLGTCPDCGYEPSAEFLMGSAETLMDQFHAALEPGTCGLIRQASDAYGDDLMARVARLLGKGRGT